MTEAQRVKVKRDGPRGWHWIAAAHYDPARHELVVDQPDQPVAPAQATTAPQRATPPNSSKSGKKAAPKE